MAGYDPNATFNEPDSDDNTSAQPLPQFTHPNSHAQKLPRPAKRNPASLARAIAMAKRAKPGAYKNG